MPLPGVAGLFPLTIFHVSFGFISLSGKDFPPMYFVYFILLLFFFFAEVLVEILSGMKGMCMGTLRKTEVLEEPLCAGLSPTPSLEAAHAALR